MKDKFRIPDMYIEERDSGTCDRCGCEGCDLIPCEGEWVCVYCEQFR